MDQSEFAANLLNTLSAVDQKHSNLLCSPLSIQTALTICIVGSRGNTLKEMMHVLHPSDSQKNKGVRTTDDDRMGTSDLVKLCQYYNAEFPLTFWDQSDAQQPVVIMVNKLWVEHNFDILDSYVAAIGVDTVGTFDKSDGQKSADIVNQWISQNTNNMITDIVDEARMSESNMLITNAIYFSGKFALPFLLEDTTENVPFYADRMRTKEIRKVSMMYSGENR